MNENRLDVGPCMQYGIFMRAYRQNVISQFKEEGKLEAGLRRFRRTAKTET